MPSSFPFTAAPPSTSPSPKLHLTTGLLPTYINTISPPLTKAPFTQIHTTPFPSTTTLLLPTSLATPLLPTLPTPTTLTHPFTLNTTLPTLLSPPLLTHFQTPSATHLSLLSDGLVGVNDTYSLHDGLLKLDLAKERYEKTGLQGRAVRSGARKHGRERFVVEVDLRGTGMRGGKKGWERVWWAVREVLGEERGWRGCLCGEGRGGVVGSALDGLGVRWGVGEEREGVREGAVMPKGLLTGREGLGEEDEDVWGLVEWVDLVALGSERVRDEDVVDGFVCRYEVPGEEGNVVVGDVTVLRWTGMKPARWISDLLMELVKASRLEKTGEDDWAVLSVTTERTEAVGNIDGHRILLQPIEAEKINEPASGVDATGTPEMDGSAANEEVEDAMEVDTSSSQGAAYRPGFQRFVCMSFVDSVQS